MNEPNLEFKAYGSDRMQWVEDWHAEFADATPAHDILPRSSRNWHEGWYIDSFYDKTVHGMVLTITNAPMYAVAVNDPYNDNSVLVDREDTFDDIDDAAHAADQLAERYAEAAREDDAKFQAEQQLESLAEDVHAARVAHRRLLTLDDAVGARLRQEQRSNAASAIKRIRLLRDEPWRAVE